MRKCRNYWNYEKCKEDSLKYEFRNDFRKGNQSAYSSARYNGWLDDICSHMKIKGNLYKRIIYVYEFSDNHVYVGLTYDYNIRNLKHLNDKRGSVFKHIKKTGLNPKYILLSDYIDVIEAQKLEIEFIQKYKNDGYILLNIKNGGELGNNLTKWSYELSKEEALKYTTRENFRKNSRGAYNAIYNNKWFELLNHMKIFKIKNFWTYYMCEKESLKYKSRSEFRKYSRSAYDYSLKNKYLNLFFTV